MQWPYSSTSLPFYFPWCLPSTPKISSAFLSSLRFPKSRRQWSSRAFLPLRLSHSTNDNLSPHRLRKKWQKMHTEVIKSWSKIISVFSGAGSKPYTTWHFKVQIVYTSRKNGGLHKQDLCSQLDLLGSRGFNKSLQSEVLQMTTEAANIIPAFKNGGGTHIVNYQAISLAQMLCKVLEPILKECNFCVIAGGWRRDKQQRGREAIPVKRQFWHKNKWLRLGCEYSETGIHVEEDPSAGEAEKTIRLQYPARAGDKTWWCTSCLPVLYQPMFAFLYS